MFRLRTLILCLLIGLPMGGYLRAENRIFLLPAGSSTQMSVLRASDLSFAGTITATGSVFDVIASNAGDKYYITSRRSTDPILVVNPQTLSVTKQIPLGVASTNSVITPDGRYLLIVGDRLRVIRTDRDEQVGSGIPVGSGPTQIIVNSVSTMAYVLAENGRAIQVIDLTDFTLVTSLAVPTAYSIALSPDDSRLAAVLTTGVRQFRTSDYQEIDTIPALVDIVNGEAFPVPGSSKLIVTSRGTAPRNTAQLFDLAGGNAKAIGSIGAVGLRDVAVVNETRAYAVLSSSEAAVIDLTNEPEAAVNPLPIGTGFDAISLSPNGKTLFLSSFTQSRVVRVNVANNAVLKSETTSQAPSGHALIYDSSILPPSQLVVNGGDGQYTPPGNQLLSPLSVRVVDIDGNPVSGVPVFFTPEPSTIAIEVSPGQPSVTNRFGIATAFVSILPLAAAKEAQTATGAGKSGDPSSQAADDPQVALKSLAAIAASPGKVEQETNPITDVRVTASTAGVTPVPLTVHVIHGTGIIKVSGDYQITSPNKAFPEPFTVLVTDDQGRPLPPRTVVNFSAFEGTCNAQTVKTDSSGFASVTCYGGDVPGSGPPYRKGGVAASVSTNEFFLQPVLFNFTVAIGGDQISIVKVAGDGQTGDTETQLPVPLTFRISAFLPIADIGVHIRQIAGPAVAINPTFLTTFPGIDQSSTITLGQNAGQIAIEVSVLSPNRPTAIFNLTAVGGQPQTFQKQGDGQTGRIGSLLPNPLRLIVFNESGQKVAFPDVAWSVVSGNAEIAAMASEPTSASARIRFGDTPGTVVVRATIAGLVADFTLTATPPQPVSISTVAGQNQTITVGSLSAPLSVRVAEAGNVPAGNVIVTFNGPSNVLFRPAKGEPGANPLQVRTDDDGLASAVAELLSVAALTAAGTGPSQVGNTVLVTATVGELTTTFQLSVIGRLPSFQAAGVVNAANRAQPGQPDFLSGLVPGSLATLFGTGLSEGINGVDLPGGATSYNGTTLRVGGIPAPLLAIKGSTPEQINFQVPFSIPPGQTTTVEVDNNGNRTTIGVIPVFSTQPGLFELTVGSGDRTAALLHQDVTNIVTPQFPAKKGEVIVGFFTGGGQVNPPVTTGQLGPIPAPVIAREVRVTVDNQDAEVLFGGYAPGFLGLYQINFRVPQTALCGTQELNVRVGDTVSPFSNVSIECE